MSGQWSELTRARSTVTDPLCARMDGWHDATVSDQVVACQRCLSRQACGQVGVALYARREGAQQVFGGMTPAELSRLGRWQRRGLLDADEEVTAS